MTRRPTNDDDRGSAIVASVVLMLTLTGGALIWLTWNADRAIDAASDANAIAFQAAHAGAQAIDPASLRTTTPTLDATRAAALADHAANELFAANLTTGRVVTVHVGTDRVTVTVEITEAGRTVTGQGTARLAVGVRGENT